VSWEGVGQGLISLSSDSSLCIGTAGGGGGVGGSKSPGGNLVLTACDQGAPQWTFNTTTFKLSPVGFDTLCIDINPNPPKGTPMRAEVWACNNM